MASDNDRVFPFLISFSQLHFYFTFFLSSAIFRSSTTTTTKASDSKEIPPQVRVLFPPPRAHGSSPKSVTRAHSVFCHCLHRSDLLTYMSPSNRQAKRCAFWTIYRRNCRLIARNKNERCAGYQVYVPPSRSASFREILSESSTGVVVGDGAVGKVRTARRLPHASWGPSCSWLLD